jgi:hypothetical protein
MDEGISAPTGLGIDEALIEEATIDAINVSWKMRAQLNLATQHI